MSFDEKRNEYVRGKIDEFVSHMRIFGAVPDLPFQKVNSSGMREARKVGIHYIVEMAREVDSTYYNPYYDILLRYMYKDMYEDTVKSEEKSELESEIGAYRYVPYDHDAFVRKVINKFSSLGKKNFIDVGCGLGDKVMFADLFGSFDSVTGVELNVHTYNVGLFFMNRWFRDLKIKHGDVYNWHMLNENAFDISFKNYDAVYMYMPICRTESLHNLYVHIINTMPKGGVLIEVGDTQLAGEKSIEDCEYCYEYNYNDHCTCYDSDDTCDRCANGWQEDKCKCEELVTPFVELRPDVKRKIQVHGKNPIVVEILD